MQRQTRVQNILERIYGPDQAQGIAHLHSVLDIEQLYRDNSAPICINVPESGSLTRAAFEGLDDADKVTINVLLDSLSSLSSRDTQQTANGFTWEELQNVLAQAGFLEPLPSQQRPGISKDMRGKRRVQWFRRRGDPGVEPDHAAVHELLRQIVQDPDPNLDPLRRLISGPGAQLVASASASQEGGLPQTPPKPETQERGNTEAKLVSAKQLVAGSPSPNEEARDRPPSKRKPTRGSSMDPGKFATARGVARFVFHGPRRSDPDELITHALSEHTKEPRKAHNKIQPSRLAQSSIVLNASSAQKYSLEPRSSTDWPVMEIITLRFPTVEEPYFTASRLTVKAWTSVDRRLILPRAQTVIRIETMSKVFGSRKAFIETADPSAWRQALARANSLFSPAVANRATL